MSLIADALKAAEREREKRRDEGGGRRARSVLGDSGQRPAPRAGTQGGRQVTATIGRSQGLEWDPKLVGAAALLTLAVLIAGVVILRGGDGPEPVPQVAMDDEFPAVDPVTVDLSQAPPPASPLEGAPPGAGDAGAMSGTDGAGSAAAGAPVEDRFSLPAGLAGRLEERPSEPMLSEAEALAEAMAMAAGDPAPIETEPVPLLEGRGRPSSLRVSVDGAAPAAAASAFEQAAAAYRTGDLAAARRLYGDAIRQDANNPELYNNLGAVHRAMGDLDAAREAFRQALKLSPRYASAWSNLGLVLQARGERAEARAAFEEAIRLDPANAAARVNLAIQYQQMGLHDQARTLLEVAIARDPALAEAHYALGQVLEAQADIPGAIREYDLFLKTSGGRFPELERQVQAHLAGLTGR